MLKTNNIINKYSDIAILMRSVKTASKEIIKVFPDHCHNEV